MKPIRRNVKQYEFITIWLEEDEDILISTYKPGLKVDINIAHSLVNSRLDYTGGQPKFMLIDFTNVGAATREARLYMNDPNGGLMGVLAGAFLANNAVATLFINLYLKINKPSVPARFFTNKADAIEWLKRLKMERKILEHQQ
jgi:hypothetical protein